ncbi:hypothetical protein [Yinghuangia sp. YIM S09857]|uniref:hypothetical protein n=1 Tax=Yinghuangia sp. YIM S09857 TaxID=3436929 RepID=UPI003F538819
MTSVGGDDDGELRGWGRVAGFVVVLVPVFVSALVLGRLTGPDAPGEDRPNHPGHPATASPWAPRNPGGGAAGADEEEDHDSHGWAPFGPAYAPSER